MDTQKFDYFMERTEQDLNHIRERVDKLWDFKTMVIGAAILCSVVCSGLVNVAFIYLDIKKP